MTKTQLKKLSIRKFRALADVEVEFGTHVTVICGKNGTSKSSILGIAAQIFNFEKDYTKDQPLKYQTITGAEFKSKYNEHFRISDQFDVPGSMDVGIELYDGYTDKPATAELGLFKRGNISRPVVRKNSTATEGNASRNFTHPVIYLSLKRLYPIADRDYKVRDFEYLRNHQKKFIDLTNELLNRTATVATSTTGIIHSAVAHGQNYDQDSVSAGEDNAGQLLMALMSFRKLQEEYPDYKGGLLLIDEADAGLFPAAQIKLIEMLNRECQELNLQAVMTSHSPTLIEYTYELSKKYQKRFKTVYLSDTYGSVQAMHDKSWPEIDADLHTRIKRANNEVSLPTVNIYFEDGEACDLFKAVMRRQPANKFLHLQEVSLSCNNYMDLAKRKIPEFASKGIICLDADVDEAAIKKLPSIVLLPGTLPPDQLIFEYLYNLPADHPLWANPIQFTRANLTNIARPLINRLSIAGPVINLRTLVDADRMANAGNKDKLRELFKKLYRHEDFQALLAQKASSYSPWQCWAKDNPALCSDFVSRFIKQLTVTLRDGHFVDSSKLYVLGKLPSDTAAKM